MNVQLITDSNGKTTGVFIPIKEWNMLKQKYKGIEKEELDVPSWHLDVVNERLENYNNNSDQGIDFDQAIDQIESEL
ncbi:MAG: addiction module protein [Prolixibacteraceae bacterium]